MLLGGRDVQGESLGDCWTFDIATTSWTKQELKGVLPPIHSHKMAMSGGNLFIFGGLLFSSVNPCNNVFVINVNSWTVQEIQVGGSIPEGRIGHSFSAIQNGTSLISIGGANRVNGVLNSVDVLENVENLSFASVKITKVFFVYFVSLTLLSNVNVVSCKDLASALKEQHNTDFAFEFVDGKQILAHRIVLAARCVALREVFENNPDQHEFVFVEEDNITFPSFQKFVGYLYMDEIEMNIDQAKDILVIAKKFNVVQLVEICSQFENDDVLVSPSSLFQDLEWMYNNASFSDVTMMCQGISVYAHKSILCARSLYFESMMGANLSEAATGVINDDETPFDVFQVLLKYLYYEDNNVPPPLVSCLFLSLCFLLP